MSTSIGYREKAQAAAAYATVHDELAVQSSHGTGQHHRKVAEQYRALAMELFRLALHVDGGGE